jgi:hypothetical protein
VVPFVDFESSRRQLLAGGVGGAHFLAAVAHDAGKGIDNFGLFQVKQGGRTKLLNRFIFKIEGKHLAQIGAVWGWS